MYRCLFNKKLFLQFDSIIMPLLTFIVQKNNMFILKNINNNTFKTILKTTILLD